MLKKNIRHIYGKIYWKITYGLVLVLIVSMFADLASAAIIRGSTYDTSLQKEFNVIIEINTSPKQIFVSKSGEYTFEVKPGTYSLYAYTNTSEALESLNVVDDGNYTLDVVLGEKLTYTPGNVFPEERDMNVSTSDIPSSHPTSYLLWTIIGLILVALVSVILLRLFKERGPIKHVHKEAPEAALDEYEHKLLTIIKKEKRTTQKDLRKELPLSEAKISLIISDLESKRKIRKIKKGRGNIIIFVKE